MKEVSKGQCILLESASNCNVDFRMSLIGFSMPKVLKTITSNDFKKLKYSPESPRLLKSQEIQLLSWSPITLMLPLFHADLQGLFDGGISVKDTIPSLTLHFLR